EKATVEALVAAIVLCREVGDDGSRLIFEPMLADGEQSIDWLETQLDLIERLGEPAYLAQHIRGGGEWGWAGSAETRWAARGSAPRGAAPACPPGRPALAA